MVADEDSRSDFQSPIFITDVELDSGQSPHSPFEASCCRPLAQASVADQSKDDGGSDAIACANYEGSEGSNRPCGEGEYGRMRESRENMERWYREQNGSHRRGEIAEKWHCASLDSVECFARRLRVDARYLDYAGCFLLSQVYLHSTSLECLGAPRAVS